ncbi:YadA family autotransporter adhesin [Sphingobium estronivorans]|uniref:YadA family autotransporter adhesin n=1 Tax=Sphingobium estronivorans TaxID=1577690 RepID=UPI0013C2FCFA|nr:YadA-like family protein [Sphingobium estronivorans]
MLAGTGQSIAAHANVVSACSGVSLPKSVLTQTIGDVITPVLAPVESTLNALPLVNINLGINAALANAAAGAPINLNVLDINGNAVNLLADPTCETTSDSFSLLTPKGISFGGNRITGLGTPGLAASAGELDAIAIGNLANTSVGAFNAVAIGSGASATHGGSVALGSGSIANGLTLNLPAYLVGGTASAEVNVGGRRITGLAAGANPTDAVNVAQLQAVNDALGTLAGNAVQYDNSARALVTLQGASGTRITNLAAGTVSATSTDAVNGSQLQATNDLVAQNSAAISQLSYDLAVLNDLAVKYQDSSKSTVVLGGVSGTTIKNLAPGSAGSDAVNVSQLPSAPSGGGGTGSTPQDALPYDPAVQAYNAARGGIDQQIVGVAPGTVSATSTDAVNGAQLYATNVQLAYNSTAITDLQEGRAGFLQVNNSSNYAKPVASGTDTLAAGAGATASGANSMAVGTLAQAQAASSVALGYASVADRANSVSVGSAGAERQITHVANGTSATDAVNLGQLQSGMGQAVNVANNYTDARINALAASDPQLVYNLTAITELQEGRAGFLQVNNSSAYAPPVASGTDTLAAGAGAMASGVNSMAVGTQAQAQASYSVALGYASVADRANSVSVGSAGAERQITHVADGTTATDAVNLRQLQSGMGQAVNVANAYTDVRFNLLNSGLRNLRRDAEGGTAASMAMAGIPQFSEAGTGTLGVGMSTWQGEHAIAMGLSKVSDNGRLIVRAAATYNSRSQGGANAGFGIAF